MKPETLKQKLQKYGISPNKVLGQNFLIDKKAVDLLIESAEIKKDDVVVEVGPGTGVITEELTKHAGEIFAIEKDPKMVALLKDEFKNKNNIRIIEEDILEFSISSFQFPKNTRYKVVGNPPYYLTARLFRYFLEETENTPSTVALIIQKEVAEKIASKPPKMNLLAVSVQLYGRAKVIKKVPRNSFWPQPEVDSAILVISDIKKPGVDEKDLFRMVRAGFSNPRKQLANNLSSHLNIKKDETEKRLLSLNIDPKRRAETLTIQDWIHIANKF